uniref:MIF4G domain-containing protein n=1 Tax=Timema bartmani TaxID=61472 RepID=A0A7R9F9F0_9NEOP|nr:unnamed protein product [Timema bartmani]
MWPQEGRRDEQRGLKKGGETSNVASGREGRRATWPQEGRRDEQHNSLEPDIGAGGDVLRTSKLSADALEFYPKSFFEKAQPTPSLHPTSSTPDYVGRHSQQGRLQKRYTSPPYTVYYQATPDEDCPPTYYNLSPAQQAAGDLIEVMHRVTISPGCFDDLVKPLIESLSSLLTDRETVETLADIIVEQSITEPNFRYNGARLCSFLNSKFHAGDEPSFRAILLNSQEIHLTSAILPLPFSSLCQPKLSAYRSKLSVGGASCYLKLLVDRSNNRSGHLRLFEGSADGHTERR